MSFKDIVLRALSTLGWATLGYLIILIPIWILAFVIYAINTGNDAGVYS